MNLAQRDVGGLVFGEQKYFVTVGDFGSAFDHNPMLCPMVVLLQAKAGTRFDLDALNLEATSFVNSVLPPPGSVYLAMQGMLVTFSGLQLGDDVFNILAAGFVGHEHRVGRFDDDQVLNADQAHQSA